MKLRKFKFPLAWDKPSSIKELYSGICASYLSCAPEERQNHPFVIWFYNQECCKEALRALARARRGRASEDGALLLITATVLDEFLNCLDNGFPIKPRKKEVNRVNRAKKKLLQALRQCGNISMPGQDIAIEGALEGIIPPPEKGLHLRRMHAMGPRQHLIRMFGQMFAAAFHHTHPTVIMHLVGVFFEETNERAVYRALHCLRDNGRRKPVAKDDSF